MSVIDHDKARSMQVEAWLELWAMNVRGNVDLGYPHITIEAEHIFGGGRSPATWPHEVQEVELAVCSMPQDVRLAMVRFYVYRRHINSIAKELHCGDRRVSGLLEMGRGRVDAWMMGRMMVAVRKTTGNIDTLHRGC